ncbi:homoserine O-acetyltransferase [Lysobacter xinjiangensis]|uniref:Homoserine O-acetyltransferase n=1 Tax=Cognatilysobacter xinjiangensis TaxID=546892 RepID=A0ABQ3BPY8_9GAMM|nr:homoserine O-succinyltransferase [Lysobacter xinjiangensis]GGZ53563.1 homoserine O-acetyltransferase [Lysobacter xinjiangensis]
MSLVSTVSRRDVEWTATDILFAPPPVRRGEFEFDLALRHAGMRRVRLRYETVGDPRLPAVFVAGGISAHRHLAANAADPVRGWWEAQVGAGRAIDPARHHVLAIDWLGADGVLDVPIDPGDQADAIAALLDRLDVAHLHAFAGASYGAMVGLQLAARHPARVDRLVAISGVHRAHPYSSAWRALQRRVVQLGALQCDGVDGLVLARQVALLGYRTPEEFEERFGAARVVDGRVHVPAEDYLDHAGQAYAARTPITAFLRLSESIDLQDVAPSSVTAPVTLVAVEQDRLVPVADAYALAQGLRGETRLRVLRSRYGHDAFLKEPEAIAAILREAIDAEQPA